MDMYVVLLGAVVARTTQYMSHADTYTWLQNVLIIKESKKHQRSFLMKSQGEYVPDQQKN